MDSEELLQKKEYKFSRIMYIIESMLEWFISILTSGAYLAKIATAIGISDSLTGILSSSLSLMCVFQIFAIAFARKKSVKRSVVILHAINQLFYSLIFVAPLFDVSNIVKTTLFISFLFIGHIFANVVSSPKINWFMSLVPEKSRGDYTANRQIVSLIGGVVVTLVVGLAMDHFESVGNTDGAFLFCGIGVFAFALIHTLTLVLSAEKPNSDFSKEEKTDIISLLKDKSLLKVIAVSVLWAVANGVSTPFYGTYQIKELGFSMLFVSVLSFIYATARLVFEKPLGRFADKHSFSAMLNICFFIEAAAFLINIFTVPENGKILFTIHYVLYAIGLAGISNCSINLIYDYVANKKIIGALALRGVFSGVFSFLTTFVTSFLVEKIQANGNCLFGINVYAQQVVSAIGAVVAVLSIIYINTVLKKTPDIRKEP